jgi:hypothetical protein
MCATGVCFLQVGLLGGELLLSAEAFLLLPPGDVSVTTEILCPNSPVSKATAPIISTVGYQV